MTPEAAARLGNTQGAEVTTPPQTRMGCRGAPCQQQQGDSCSTWPAVAITWVTRGTHRGAHTGAWAGLRSAQWGCGTRGRPRTQNLSPRLPEGPRLRRTTPRATGSGHTGHWPPEQGTPDAETTAGAPQATAARATGRVSTANLPQPSFCPFCKSRVPGTRRTPPVGAGPDSHSTHPPPGNTARTPGQRNARPRTRLGATARASAFQRKA